MPFKLPKHCFMKNAKNLFFLVIIVAICLLSFWFALKYVLNTEHPVLPVSSGDMCTVSSHCDGFSHPFAPTLHVGDLIFVQGINPENVNSDYPDSDILVFYSPKQNPNDEDKLIITRVVEKQKVNGILYFLTKSDGKGKHKWPKKPDMTECDYWLDYRENYAYNGMISEKLLVGKVIFRIPWIGHILLFISSYFGLLFAIIVIVLLVAVKVLIPKLKERKPKPL